MSHICVVFFFRIVLIFLCLVAFLFVLHMHRLHAAHCLQPITTNALSLVSIQDVQTIFFSFVNVPFTNVILSPPDHHTSQTMAPWFVSMFVIQVYLLSMCRLIVSQPNFQCSGTQPHHR